MRKISWLGHTLVEVKKQYAIFSNNSRYIWDVLTEDYQGVFRVWRVYKKVSTGSGELNVLFIYTVYVDKVKRKQSDESSCLLSSLMK
ncbi:hypothetical protein VIMY103929_16295 [Vibrio mytili]